MLFQELLSQLSFTFGIPSEVFWGLLGFFLLVSATSFGYQLTGSFTLGSLCSIPVLVGGVLLGVFPLWVVLAMGVPVVLVAGIGVLGTGGETKMVNQLIQDPAKLPKTRGISLSLAQEFEALGAERGSRALRKLESVNSDLVGLFARVSGIDESLVNIARMRELTTSVYERGISLLSSTLEIVKQTGVASQFELMKECEELEEELLRYKDSKVSMYLRIQERLDKNTRILELVKGNADRLDETLANVGLCIDSLREISLELPELISHKSEDGFDKVLLELKTRVEFAQRVKEEYSRQGL